MACAGLPEYRQQNYAKHVQDQVHYLVFNNVENLFWLFYICLYIRVMPVL